MGRQRSGDGGILGGMPDARVLVVEDDHALRDVLARGLRKADFEVVTATDGASALRVADQRFDAIVLDIGLPDSDGRDVCQALRARGVTSPVIFLTARGNLTDRLSGFSAGGDDYMTKPFHIAELLARLEVAVRRSGADLAVEVHGLRLDPVTHALHGPGGSASLTPTEFRLLACILASPGQLVRRRTLERAAWPDGAMVSDNVLDKYLSRVRKKLTDVGAAQSITTARGLGY
ncbi:MAG: response regulator transcription factor, partial [Frankiales bacterium]|nr:response regulator transcription factor [Frankiales bacterium]